MRQIDGAFTPGSVADAPTDIAAERFDPSAGRVVALPLLLEGTQLTLRTRNSCYRMVVVDGATRRVRISGGWVFPASTEVEVAGATGAGDGVKLGWIAEGLQLQLFTDFGPVVTSTVESIEVDVTA